MGGTGPESTGSGDAGGQRPVTRKWRNGGREHREWRSRSGDRNSGREGAGPESTGRGGAGPEARNTGSEGTGPENTVGAEAQKSDGSISEKQETAIRKG